MKTSKIEVDGKKIPLCSLNTLIIGSGAAALNAAVSLYKYGQEDIAIATDLWGGGTSNNAGSDKQTYYKLSVSGDSPDSPLEMAQDLANGGCMHGDIALCEAMNSAQAFFNLVSLGVPFPYDRYGGYVGYKTDHDLKGRAASAGPLTSHLMFKALSEEVKENGIVVFDRHEIVGLLSSGELPDKNVVGAIAIDRNNIDPENYGFVIFNAVNVVFATGGPAGIYKTSVYPESQIGSHGLAFAVGAIGHNLTESQFGLASIKFRWNLSGTYQQVIPRYVSTDKDGKGEREFLNDYFPDIGKLATAIFLKGYQWPFDPRKVDGHGSSLIDILVYQETVLKGRRVFLDFMRSPGGGALGDFAFECLGKEAYEYLENSDALLGTPIERLQKMNQPAIDLYKDHGIDITKEHLEIAVCAQHNNGGLKGNIWWESNVRHLFPVGEVNGTHGVYRPGGSALNSGQVGSLRAALYIARRYAGDPPHEKEFFKTVREQITDKLAFADNIFDPNRERDVLLQDARKDIQERMTACGAHIRDPKKIKQAKTEAWDLYRRLQNDMSISSAEKLPEAFKNMDLCLTHALYLETIAEYLEKGGQSRGSYLVLNLEGKIPCEELGDEWKFLLNDPDSFVNKKILEVSIDAGGNLLKQWVDIRPIPQEETWFENVWNQFLKNNIIR
ncbi:MAG: FAD-binding protein [Candidatus Aminicenantes bacterium]|nr:MAG: FAD-binding protein [Candidatus Aminicenantes bacterium]